MKRRLVPYSVSLNQWSGRRLRNRMRLDRALAMQQVVVRRNTPAVAFDSLDIAKEDRELRTRISSTDCRAKRVRSRCCSCVAVRACLGVGRGIDSAGIGSKPRRPAAAEAGDDHGDHRVGGRSDRGGSLPLRGRGDRDPRRFGGDRRRASIFAEVAMSRTAPLAGPGVSEILCVRRVELTTRWA